MRGVAAPDARQVARQWSLVRAVVIVGFRFLKHTAPSRAAELLGGLLPHDPVPRDGGS